MTERVRAGKDLPLGRGYAEPQIVVFDADELSGLVEAAESLEGGAADQDGGVMDPVAAPHLVEGQAWRNVVVAVVRQAKHHTDFGVVPVGELLAQFVRIP